MQGLHYSEPTWQGNAYLSWLSGIAASGDFTCVCVWGGLRSPLPQIISINKSTWQKQVLKLHADSRRPGQSMYIMVPVFSEGLPRERHLTIQYDIDILLWGMFWNLHCLSAANKRYFALGKHNEHSMRGGIQLRLTSYWILWCSLSK